MELFFFRGGGDDTPMYIKVTPQISMDKKDKQPITHQWIVIRTMEQNEPQEKFRVHPKKIQNNSNSNKQQTILSHIPPTRRTCR
jgi:hypothetical protein